MSNKRWTLFVLVCVMISLNVFAQKTPMSKFDGGYFHAGIRDAETDKQIALFLDPSRTSFTSSASDKSYAHKLVQSVAANASRLTSLIDVVGIFTDNVVIQGKAARGMLHIVLFPIQGTSVIDKTAIQDPLTFQPAALKSLKEIKAEFGEPSEQELWSFKIAQDLGLNGVVCWWGGVGVAANVGGSITHVLLRKEPEK